MKVAALWQKVMADKKGFAKKSLPFVMALVLVLAVTFFAIGNPNEDLQKLASGDGWLSVDAFHEEIDAEKQALEQSKQELEQTLAQTQELIDQLTASNQNLQNLLNQATQQKGEIQNVIQDMKDAYQQEEENALLKWVVPMDYLNVSSHFGYRMQPTDGASSFHSGVDLAGPTGTPIVATRTGTVTKATYDEYSGYYVNIDHYDGYTSRYLHMHKFIVTPGQVVMAGQVIGYCGESGVTTGAHLHFAIYLDGEAVNPAKYMDIK